MAWKVYSDKIGMAMFHVMWCGIRFILNNKMATMYSSGNPEDGSESNKNKNEFLEKLRQARFSVKPSLGSVDSTVFAYELLRLRLRSFRFVLIINVV